MNNSNKDEALAIANSLKGSNANYLQTVLFWVLSMAAVWFGILNYDYGENATTDRKFLKQFMILSLGFMLNAIFNLSKLIRDTLISDLYAKEEWTYFTRGTISSRVQTYFAFAIALYVPFQTVIKVSKDDAKWTGELGFLLLGLLFSIQTSMNLAKVVRDYNDAVYFEQKIQKNNVDIGKTIGIMKKVKVGTHAFVLVNVISTIISSYSLLSAVYNFDDMGIDRKLLIVVGVFLMMYAAVMLSKLVRDFVSPIEDVRKSITFGYVVVIVLGFLLGLAFSLGVAYGLHDMKKISTSKFKFIFVGELYILTSVFSVSKLVRDATEKEKYR